MDRIVRQNPNVDRIILKMNEYMGTETSAKRETNYIDAVILLCAFEHNIIVERKLNSQIGSSSVMSKEFAEQQVGRTEQHWNNTIADAILAAFWGIRK